MKSAAIIIPCLLVGGTEVASLNTAKALIQLGYTIQVVVLFDETDPLMVGAFQTAGIEVICLNLSRCSGLSEMMRLSVKLWRALAGGRDTIWVQYMTPTFVPLLIARFRTYCLIACVHVAASHYKSLALIRLRFMARWWCDRFICVSRSTALGIFGEAYTRDQSSAKVFVLPNALDEEQIQEAPIRDWRMELGIPSKDLIIGYVGRLAHNKGVDVLLQAIALLVQERISLHCVIVGDGEDRDKLQCLVHELNISGCVHFVGAVSRLDVYAAFKGFDVAIVPSREEGFGLSATEAMACGILVVASAVDALRELIIDGQTGMLVPVDDPSSLAVALSSLTIDSLETSHMRSKALLHASETYKFHHYKARLGQILENELPVN